MSSDDEDYPECPGKNDTKDPFFSDIDDMFREMEKMMDEELKNFTEKVPKEYIKERKLPDGSTVKELGPFVYGYSMKSVQTANLKSKSSETSKKDSKDRRKLKRNANHWLTLLKQTMKSTW